MSSKNNSKWIRLSWVSKSSSKIDNLIVFNLFYPTLDYTIIDKNGFI